MSDADVKALLREKNIEITKNKMLLDVENNIDSFKKNIENIINLEISNIERILKKEFDLKNSMLIDSLRTSIEKCFLNELERISIIFREFIYKTSLNNKFIPEYEKTFENIVVFDVNSIDAEINNIVEKHIDVNDEFIGTIEKKIASKINDKILQKVNIQFRERINIIINNSKETYNKYLLLNKKTK